MKKKIKKTVSALELRRQSFHIFIGTTLGLLFFFGFVSSGHLVLLFCVLFIVFLLYRRVYVPLAHDMVDLMERREDIQRFPGRGALFLVLGILFSTILFSRSVAAAAILVLSWGDGVAPLVGPFGSHAYLFNKKKMWEGILAGIVAGTLATSFFVPFWQAFVAATAAMLVEGLNLRVKGWKVDDNVTVPLISGLLLTFLSFFT